MKRMKKIRINDNEHFVPEPKDRRLVNAIKFGGYRIDHRCGGHAQCTTCRVKFHKGEPKKMTVAEYSILNENNLLGSGIRLSCQVEVEEGMKIDVLMHDGNTSKTVDPAQEITPNAEWID